MFNISEQEVLNKMSKLEAFLFLLILSCSPHTCQTQQLSGEPLIIETKNLLAMTEVSVQSANTDAARVQTKIKELRNQLRQNATAIREKIETVLNDTLESFQERIDGLSVNDSDVAANYCGISNSSVKSTAADILMDINTCVSSTVESIESNLTDTYSSIEFYLGNNNSDQNLATACIAEYDKTDMGLKDAIATALCVTQTRERILSAIKDGILTRSDAAILDALQNDAMNRLTSCDDTKSVSSFVTNTDSIYLDVMTCVSDS